MSLRKRLRKLSLPSLNTRNLAVAEEHAFVVHCESTLLELALGVPGAVPGHRHELTVKGAIRSNFAIVLSMGPK